MPSGTNFSPGTELMASGTVIFQSVQVVANASVPPRFFPAFDQRVELNTTNLPTLMWYLWLERAWTDAGGVLRFGQLGVTFTPIIQVNSSRNAGPLALGAPMLTQGLPFSAPIALPVGVPTRVNIRAPVETISFIVNTPALPAGALNRIHFILAASQ